MKTIYIVSDGRNETEGVFDEDCNRLLGWWSTSDAKWRSEYFNGFMRAVGVQVECAPSHKRERALAILRDQL